MQPSPPSAHTVLWPESPASTEAVAGLPCHDARALLAGNATAQIALDGQIYTLRLTRSGKLILTK